MIIDLSHKLAPGMPAYPGLPVPKFHVFLARNDASRQTHYAPGTTFQIASYELGGNTGTYVDAPFHRHAALDDLATLPLEKLANLPGIVIPAPEDGPIEPAIFSPFALRGKAVLVHTNWSRHWGSATTSALVPTSPQQPASTLFMPVRRSSASTAPTSTT